jgi:hypothetical protein
LLLAVLGPVPATWAAGKGAPKKGGTVWGIVIDKRDDWLTVRADREEEAVKYVIPTGSRRLRKAAKRIFTISRVKLRYRLNGETRALVSIVKAVTPAKGTVTGVVLYANEFWVLVKPRSGPPDAYASLFVPVLPKKYQEAYKPTLARLKALKKGDTVRIGFVTDFERHRILTLERIAKVKKKD